MGSGLDVSKMFNMFTLLMMAGILILLFMPRRDFLGFDFRRQLEAAQDPVANFDESDDDEPSLELNDEENDNEKRLREAGYEGDIPEAFRDPISRSIMATPVILITDDHSTTHSFDEQSVLNIMASQEQPRCPLTNRRFDAYILNRDLKNLIDVWMDETIKAMENTPLHALPRELAKKKMQESQLFFKSRKPKIKDQTKEVALSKSLRST